MNFSHKCLLSLAIFLSGLFTVSSVFAQAPSLAPSDAYYMTAKTEFGNETFTIIRDGRIEEQFYFIPARPHVAIENRNGKNMPVFELLSFQRAINGELKQGAILQLSVQMAISQKTQDELLSKIKSTFPLTDKNKKHRLSPVPIKDSSIVMYDLGGDMLAGAPVKGGVAPMFGNQQYPFMLNLTELGADTMEALCRGKGGLPVLISYTFQGMTPAGGFKVEIDWDASYKHFSTDTKLKAQVAYMNLTGSLGADFSTIREQMISNGMIKVTSLSNEAFPPEKIDAVLEPIITLMTKELFEQIKLPDKIPPAVAKEIAPVEGPKSPAADTVKQAGEAIAEATSAASTAIPYVGTMMKILEMAAKTKMDLGASFSLKDVKVVKKGRVTYTYDRQAIVERKTSFGGPIGIGAFPKEIQDNCISILPPGHWETAYFLLPSVGDLEQFGATGINMTVRAVESGKPISGIPTQLATFNYKKDGLWRDSNGQETSRLFFPLKAIYASDAFKNNPQNFKFKVTTDVLRTKGPRASVTTETPMFDGNNALAAAGELMLPVSISAECISFGDGADEVFMVKGVLCSGNTKFPISLKQEQATQAFLVPATEKSITIRDMVFLSKKGKKIGWKNNGKELRELAPDLELMLFDSDWQENPDSDSITEFNF